MKQKYKAVYFPDSAAHSQGKKTLTLAFGKNSIDVYECVKDLSSAELRQLLGGSYRSISDRATEDDLPINTYCIRHLRTAVRYIRESTAQLTLPNMEVDQGAFDPVSVTFKGGKKEPFARWYPYLEGYSTQYVESILNKYAPNSTSVLDPFAGTGTTPLTVAQRRKKAYFCEINPVLQYISLTKMRIRRLRYVERSNVARELLAATESLQKLDDYTRSRELAQSYEQAFADSQFFSDTVYDQVLRTRSWINEVEIEKPMLANLITIATISALVPASRMKRAGDLRYKTAKESNIHAVRLTDCIQDNIEKMAQDIQGDAQGLRTEPILICENARSLDTVSSLGLDAVITSPPYLNGTNYFRNTKIELWFLKCLKTKDDLSNFRASSLTAGINDVTVAKTPIALHPDVEKTVSVLERNAYDSRIPRMIASYFDEMTCIFRAIRKHLTSCATLAIDIGDSCYAGIHVPVDQLLSECFRDLGYEQEDDVTLRQRRSRSGTLLKQSLLVFKYSPIRKKQSQKGKTPRWRTEWDDFKLNLPHQKYPYTKRNWGHPRHSLCSYPGKLKPAIAHHLVRMFVPIGGRVLDPFAGVGTIPFEASIDGKLAYGFEISPAALLIASAKVQHPTIEGCNHVLGFLKEFVECNSPTKQEITEVNNLGFNGKISDYYEARTLNEVILARRYFLRNPPETSEERFVTASLLHVLHGNRPYALSRRSHPLTPYKPTGPYEYRPLVDRLGTKIHRVLDTSLPSDFKPGKVYFQDATGWWPSEIDQLDAVITSPPFFDSTRFYLANWLRLWFAGWSERDFTICPSVFVDEKQKRGFEVYEPILRQARERLKHDGVVVMHLGKSVKCDMAKHLLKLSKQWFRSADLFDESVAHCESHGVRDKGTVTTHQYLVLY